MTHTISFLRIGLFSALALFAFLATPTHAYFTTGQNAKALEGGMLFTIDYSFGNPKHDVYLPFNTHQGDSDSSKETVSYTILDENNIAVPGKVATIILSTAELEKDGMYKISKGTAGKFTLVAVFIPEAPQKDATYRLQVTNLPFSFDKTQQLQLNPSELVYYTTKSIAL